MPQKHLHGGHRSRLRARFAKDPEGLEDHELMELLLFYAIPQKDTNALAHDLLNRFGSISKLVNANPRQIQNVPGMGEISSQLFPVLQEVLRRYFRETMEARAAVKYDPAAVGSRYLSCFFGKAEEHVLAIALDEGFSVVEHVEIGQGNFVSSRINTTILSDFIHGTKPCSIVIAHNHPSGVALPSNVDFETTDYLRKFIFDSGSALLDHLIFDGRGDFISLGLSGQMTDSGNRAYYQVSQVPGNAPGEIKFSIRKKSVDLRNMTKDQTKENIS